MCIEMIGKKVVETESYNRVRMVLQNIFLRNVSKVVNVIRGSYKLIANEYHVIFRLICLYVRDW